MFVSRFNKPYRPRVDRISLRRNRGRYGTLNLDTGGLRYERSHTMMYVLVDSILEMKPF